MKRIYLDQWVRIELAKVVVRKSTGSTLDPQRDTAEFGLVVWPDLEAQGLDEAQHGSIGCKYGAADSRT